MPQPEWDALVAEVRDLQSRVLRLEGQLGLSPVSSQQSTPDPARAASRGHKGADSARPEMLPLLGRALLGLAGAYLLRALTESGTLPQGAGVGVGLLYAMSWLVWAARTPAERRLETALHGLTSALVISPLLFEATSRFHAISTWTAGGLLVLFTVFGLAVSWRKNLLIAATFATLAGLGTAGALLIATHDALPFTLVFLAIAAAVEVSACLDHWLSERWLTAAAADLAVVLLTWLVTNERGIPESYVPVPYAALVAAQIALLVVSLSSTIVRTLARGIAITWFEIAQCAAAFAIAVGSGRGTGITVLYLVCAAACYLVAFRVLDRAGRNFYTYSTFGLLLALAGSRLLLSGTPAAIAWSALAIAGAALPHLTLQVHGGIYLLLALGASGALQQAGVLLLGSQIWPPGEPWTLWMGLAAAAVCYFVRDSTPILKTAKAAALVWLAGGILAGLLTFGYHTAFGTAATHAYCATLRTAVLAGAALLLAALGRFAPLVYPLMILGAWRLVAVDFHQDRTAALFLSLLLYGAALMVLPRLARKAN